jgi:hypothetical protein
VRRSSFSARHAALCGSALCALFLGAVASPVFADNAPAHVKNFTFWRQSGIATNVPAAWIASNVTFVEIGRADDARAFHAAGGTYAVVYTDPNYYFVSASYRSHGDFPESAFGHDAAGVRITRPQGNGIEHYLLPNSPATREAYRRVTVTDADDAYDFVFADGVSDTLQTSLYRMSGRPVEIQNDDDYQRGMKRVLGASARPVIANGYDNGSPLSMLTYASAPNVAGIYGEACLQTDAGPKLGQRWIDEANALLATTERGRYAFCGGHYANADNQAARVYWLASWWLTYDPRYSVAAEIFESPGEVYVFAESALVARSPLRSAGSDIAALRSSSGAYVREFARCYKGGSAIGPCAAVVNPTSNTVSMPALSVNYGRVLALDPRNLFAGGSIAFTHGVPATLGPGQAVVLFL